MIRHFERTHNLPETYICLLSADTPEECEKDQYEYDTFICKPLTYFKQDQLIKQRKSQISQNEESLASMKNTDNYFYTPEFPDENMYSEPNVQSNQFEITSEVMNIKDDHLLELKHRNMPTMSEIDEKPEESMADVYGNSLNNIIMSRNKCSLMESPVNLSNKINMSSISEFDKNNSLIQVFSSDIKRPLVYGKIVKNPKKKKKLHLTTPEPILNIIGESLKKDARKLTT